jgi:hypothetical protein
MECAICNSKMHWAQCHGDACGVCDKVIKGQNAYYCNIDDTFFHFKCLKNKNQLCNICGKCYDNGTAYNGGYAHIECLYELSKTTMPTEKFQNVIPMNFNMFD